MPKRNWFSPFLIKFSTGRHGSSGFPYAMLAPGTQSYHNSTSKQHHIILYVQYHENYLGNRNCHLKLESGEELQSTRDGMFPTPVPLRHCPGGLCSIFPLSVSSNDCARSSPLHCFKMSRLCWFVRQRVNCLMPPLEYRDHPCRQGKLLNNSMRMG